MKKIAISLAVLAVLAFSGERSQAQLFWRTDGTTGTWTGPNWSAAPSPTGGTAYTANTDADFTANSTVTFATVSIGNVTLTSGITVTVTAAGTLSTGGAVRVFDIGSGSILNWTGQTVTANSTTGFTKNGLGTWNMGAWTFSTNETGGFTMNAGTVIVSGAKSFGNGAMTINGGTIQSSGGNTFTPTSLVIGGDFAFAGTGNDVWAQPVDVGAALRTITNSTTSTATRTFSGNITGSGGINIAGTGGTGGIVFSGTNAYGATTLSGSTLSISSDANVGGASSTINFNGGTLRVTGTTLTSFGTHVVNYGTFNGGIDVATAANTFTVSQSLGGSGSLSKLGAGTLALTTGNTYSGGTTIAGGTLVVSANGGLGGGNVSLTAGNVTLSLQGATNSIADSANLNIGFTNDVVNLAYSGTDTIGGLIINNTAQPIGTYGAVGSGAQFENSVFTGSGFINVTTLAVIPEPATYMLIGLGALVCAQQFRKRKQA